MDWKVEGKVLGGFEKEGTGRELAERRGKEEREKGKKWLSETTGNG